MSAINIKHRLFRIHCFNKYGKNENDDCPDLEVTYYIECYEKIEKEDLDLRESYMRRKNNAPIICQHESTNNSIPENKTTDLQEVAITTETPNTFDQWTASQEDSSTEQMTTLNDGIFQTQEDEIKTETSNTLGQSAVPQEVLSTEQIMTTLNDESSIFETHEMKITIGTTNTMDQSTASQEDSSTEQMVTTLNDGIFQTQEVEIKTGASNTMDQSTASQEDSSTEQIVTNLNDESSIFKTQEVEITTETSNTFELGCPPGGFLAKTSRDISCFFTANVNAYFAEYFKKLE